MFGGGIKVGWLVVFSRIWVTASLLMSPWRLFSVFWLISAMLQSGWSLFFFWFIIHSFSLSNYHLVVIILNFSYNPSLDFSQDLAWEIVVIICILFFLLYISGNIIQSRKSQHFLNFFSKAPFLLILLVSSGKIISTIITHKLEAGHY